MPEEPSGRDGERPTDRPVGMPAILRWGIAGGALILLVGPLLIWRAPIMSVFADREHLVSLIRNAGPWGPSLLVALTVIQTIAAPIPGQLVGLGAGYLFGFWQGALYNWAGTMLGSAAAISIARIAGRPLVLRLAGGAALDRLDRYARGHGLGFFLLVFVVPFLPDDLACFLAGLSPLPLAALLPLVAIARIPGVVTAVWIGAHADGLDWRAWAALAIVTLAALGIAWRSGGQIQERLLSWIDRHSR